MDFIEEITQFANRVKSIKGNILTEEATKTSIILPFFQILGYDVFNPFEFVPEFTADVGTKKGEKVDYAIMVNNDPLILIEAKSLNVELNVKHMNQLLRYFSVTKAKFAILTNGIVYRFYSDLEESNKMDTIPFLEFDILNLKSDAVESLKRFRKETLDVKSIIDSASELKYMATVKKTIVEQFEDPSDQLIKVLIKPIYSGMKTQAVLDKFRDIIKIAFNEHVNDLIASKINSAISFDSPIDIQAPAPEAKSEFELSELELDALNFVKNILNTDKEITYKKTSRYAYMQLGNSSTKWICRVYVRPSNNLFTLHKFDGVDYECEYYFDSPDQLGLVSELIHDVFNRCCAL